MRVLSFVFGLILFGALSLSSAWAEAPRAVPASREQVQLSYAPIVKAVAPAVVNIYTRKVVRQRVISPFMDDPFFQQFFGGAQRGGMTRQRLENSLGSGVLVKPSGLIVTSYHVVAGADEITVVLADRREFEATIVTKDEKSDLAVLQINAKGETLPFLQIKDSDEAEVGDMVLAIGNPFGVGQTVTSGIISALARTNLDINDLNYFIQTDAAINPGNSGGALVTMDGKLVGINAAIFSKSGGSMGIGFAVPSNMVRAIIEGGKPGGKSLVRPWVGITGQSVTNDIAASLGLPRPVGVLVNQLHPASPAAKAGMKAGDVITSVNGKDIDDPASFGYRIATMPIGSEATLGIIRKGQALSVPIKLIAPPETLPREETLIKGQNPLAGATIANLSPAVAEQYGLKEGDETGVVIVAVGSSGPAARLGLDVGDVILKINGQEIKSVTAANDLLKAQPKAWRLTIRREGEIVNMLIGG